jgi:NADH-quinone oxidoreductase subunit F
MNDKKILICCGTGCLANHSQEVLDRFKEELADVAIDVKPYVKATGCNGLCEKGPVVKFKPENISYFSVGVDDVDEIIEKTVLKGQVVERLLYYDTNTDKPVVNHEDSSFYKHQQKLALRNIGEVDPKSLDDYLSRDGYAALRKALDGREKEWVIQAIKASGLRGRGGAGFPTGVKWEVFNHAVGDKKFIVCNGDEGDPGAFMDRSIMEGDPFSIIEGMTIAGIVSGAKKGFLYIRDEYRLARINMQQAIDIANEKQFLGNNILSMGAAFELEIVRGGGAFVCGEETALMASIEGDIGEPRPKYTVSAVKGLWNAPTLVNNVETWANVPLILNKGPKWFADIGIENNTGTKVFSLVGKVKNTGLVEVPMGTSIDTLVNKIGGGIIGDKGFKAVQTGGPSGGCIPAKYKDLSLDFESLKTFGSIMGSGGIIVMDEDTCMVEVARYYMAFLAEESCGKCTTCREGISLMLKILTGITEGRGKVEDLDLLLNLCDTVEKGSLCGLGKTAPNPVKSTIEHFRQEYMEHIVDHKCQAGVCKPLTSYTIDPEKCVGCSICKTKCPVKAISGERKSFHVIDQALCIRCGACYEACPVNAIGRGGALDAVEN